MTSAQGPCPLEVIQLIDESDLETDIGEDLFERLINDTSRECQVFALLSIGVELTQSSHPSVVGEFTELASMLSRLLTTRDVFALRDAYVRMPYYPEIMISYFSGLRRNQIDIRSHLKELIPEDWEFDHPRNENAETWHYQLYCASLGDPDALQKLTAKMASTHNINDLVSLLKSFADVDRHAATTVLQSYSDDPRQADSILGPGTGIAISDAIKVILEYRR